LETIDFMQRRMTAAGLPLDERMLERFTTFHRLLLEKNGYLNLVSPGDEERIFSRHFLESAGLAIACDFKQNSRVMDLGSGAGFPGIPLKIVRPDLQVSLVESRKKKAAFIQTVVDTLDFKDTEVLPQRAEDLPAQEAGFDYVVTRAVADLARLLKWCRNTLKPGGSLIALKGPGIEAELKVLKKTAVKLQVRDISTKPYLPFTESLRENVSTIVIISK